MPGPNFDDPDADWTDEYAWTRWRGPQPYPCPSDWVLNEPEGTIVVWNRFAGIGDGQETTDDVYEALDYEQDDIADARGERAVLMQEILDTSLRTRDPDIEHELTIGDETVFRRVEPDGDDLFAAVAEALARYSSGEEVATLAEEIVPDSGSVPDDIQRERDLDRREEENQSLEEFADQEADHGE